MTDVQAGASTKTTSRILSSTAIIGAANVVVTLLRILRTKAFAIWLGPTGMGLLGLYSSIMNTATVLSEMGVGSSGVRQIAEVSDEPDKLAGKVFSLWCVTGVLGTVGAVGLVLLSKKISRWTFGSDLYVAPIALLAVGVLFQIISDSQVALLNGLRRVGDLARVNMIGSLIGTVPAIIIVWLKGERAIAAAVVIPIVSQLACSWWAARDVRPSGQRPNWAEVRVEIQSLLKLGAAFMISGLMMNGALLITRLIFVNQLGLAATGLLQAAWGIAVTNIDFILSAMGVDFYPHLSSCIKRDPVAANHLVNDQTEVALLLGSPLIIGMITFGDPLIHVFFSGKFVLAAELLRWLVLGTILKLVSWPLSYLILAHGWAAVYFAAEAVWSVSYVGGVYVSCRYFGLESAGYAFVAAYLVYVVFVYFISYSQGSFRWSRANQRLFGGLSIGGILVMILLSHAPLLGYLGGTGITLAFAIFGLKRLCDMVTHPTAKRISGLMSQVRTLLSPHLL